MAGMVGINHNSIVKVERSEWIVDREAINHMTFGLSILTDIELFRSEHDRRVLLPN